MKATLNRVAASALALGLGMTSAHAAPVTTTATANAEIVEDLTLVEDQQLNFGRIAPDTAAASVVTIGAVAAPTASATNSPSLLGGEASGQFTITGQTGKTVDVTLPAAAIQVCDDGGTCGAASAKMTVDNFTSNAASFALAGGAGTSTATLYVGADLTVAPTQAVGVYQGSYDVSVNYQ